MFALAPAAQAAAPTLAQITARLRTSAQYDDPAAKVTAAQKARDHRSDQRRAREEAHRARRDPRRAPSDAPGDTAARRLRARLKLQGTVVVALPNGTQIASINVGGKRLAQAQALVANEGGYAGARAAIDALTAPRRPHAHHDADHDDDRRRRPRRPATAVASRRGSTS